MSGLLLNIGAIAALWGILWYLWDHNADAPRWLMVCGLAGLITGNIIS
jgi:hypothetical protein